MTHPSPTALEEISGALDALRTDQRQLDQDGVFVGVSRQALDEVLTHIAALEAELAQATRERDEWETQSENQCFLSFGSPCQGRRG